MNLDAAIQLHQAGDLQGAEKGYREAIEQSLRVHLAYVNLGRICLNGGRLDEAVEFLTMAAKLDPQRFDAHYFLGVSLHRKSRLEEAITQYRAALELCPESVDARNDLAAALWIKGHPDQALPILTEIIRLHPQYAAAYLNLGGVFASCGQLDKALESYSKVTEIAPGWPKGHFNRGNVLLSLRRIAECIESYQRAIAADPSYVNAYLNLGNVFIRQERQEEAGACFTRLLEIDPNCVEAHNNLGLSLFNRGDCEAALAAYRKAIAIKPDFADAYCNMGLALHGLGRQQEAFQSLNHALTINANHFAAYNNLGVVLQHQGKTDEAIACYRKTVELNPRGEAGYNDLGAALQKKGLFDEAEIAFRKSIELKPDYVPAYTNLGISLQQRERLDEALECFHKILDITFPEAESEGAKKLAGLLTELLRIPVLYANPEQIETCRKAYTSCLDQALNIVSQELEHFSLRDRKVLCEIVFGINGFYLAYQQQNDCDLQIAYSKVASAIFSFEARKYLRLNHKVSPREKIRFGIASEYLSSHNGSILAYGWLSNLPKEDYEFFLYSLNGKVDEVTEGFAGLGTFRWLPFKSRNYLKALEVIRQDDLDILLLPDVGMSNPSRVICQFRLAPIQCVGWGHPITTGSANIDFYLSGELMENPYSDACYSEKLIRLPNVGLFFEPMVVPGQARTRADFGLPEDRVIYGGVQSLFKYLPQFDYIYPAIARLVPDAFFVFVGNEYDGVNAAFEQRIRKAFKDAELDFDCYVKILPRMTLSAFTQLIRVIDLNLDSIGWSGGITTVRTLSIDCPLVTLPGKFMRGLHSYGMLKMIGMEELIANSIDEYIAIAARIGGDRNLRASIVEKIKAKKHLLFHDRKCVEYLDSFLKHEVARRRIRPLSPPYLLQGMKGVSLHLPATHAVLSQLKRQLLLLRKKAGQIKRDYQLKTPVEIKSGQYNHRGYQLEAQGNFEAAAECYTKAFELLPSAGTCNNMSSALIGWGKLEEAIAWCKKSLELEPINFAAHNNCGVCLMELGKIEESIEHSRKALELHPYPGTYNNLGNAYLEQKRLPEAIEAYGNAIKLRPDFAQAYDNLGLALTVSGRLDDSISAYHKGLELRTAHLGPDCVSRKVGRLLHELRRLPVIYNNESEIEASRNHYADCLTQALNLVSGSSASLSDEERGNLRRILFKINNFYLGYQQRNDKDLQIEYCKLITEILRPEISPYLVPDRIVNNHGKIRVGIATEMLKRHNGSSWAYGWLSNLPRDDYEFFLYSLSGQTDDMTRRFASLGTYRWLPFRDSNYQYSLATIKQDQLDVLILPDVGMTASSKVLSTVRLAPIQCVGWGHPITTGSPHVDFYLSSDLMETAEADNHYSEQLVRLPNTGLCVEPPPVPAEFLTRAQFGLPEDRIIFGSVQSLFKYLPQYDFIYPEIARRVPEVLFVFAATLSPGVTTAFTDRLAKCFKDAGVDFDKHVKLLPHMPLYRFTQLLSVLDVNIDSVGWTGGITTLRSLAADCPVITIPGEFMRGRHTYSMLKIIGAGDLIAYNLDDYISLACKMAVDKKFRLRMVAKIKKNKHKLFNDLACTIYLDAFFKTELSRLGRGVTPNPVATAAGVH